MKMFVTAKIMSIEWIVFNATLLAAIVKLYIHFAKTYTVLFAIPWLVYDHPIFNCSHALKRVVDTIAHLRKFALFPGGTRQ